MPSVTEGSASFRVPDTKVTRKSEAFYNPDMRHQRDVTVAALSVFSKLKGRGIAVCDPLAGTGVRTMRIAAEVPGVESIASNDSSASALKVLRSNVSRIKGAKADVAVSGSDAVSLMHGAPGAFDYVDIDPFGSPVRFLQAAAASLRHGSMLGVTATDTGALCGTFPSRCLSRYGIVNTKTDFFKETGVRVLITSVMLELARRDMAFVPVYCHANHYFRVIGLVERKKSRVSSNFSKVGMVSYCPSCLWRSRGAEGKCPECGKPARIIGPLWTGSIGDNGFCRKMLDEMESRGFPGTGEVRSAVSELGHPFYYDLHRLFRAQRKIPKKTDDVISSLEGTGFRASRTHLCPTGIITDSPHRALVRLL